jgi:SNF2 family DNA or RNA helicase
MKVEVSSEGIKLIFKFIDGDKKDFNLLKMQFGIENIQTNPYDSNQISIDHLVFFGIEATIIKIIKEEKIIPKDSFKLFYTSITSQSNQKEREITPELLKEKLSSEKFTRELRPFQIANVIKLNARDFGATFSVPGAGKTSEILSTFSFFKADDSELKLLIICPKNAFSAWDEQIDECYSNSQEINQAVIHRDRSSSSGKMVRLTGGRSNIADLLNQNPDTMMITFQQLAQGREIIDEIASYLSKHNVFCAVDESHRIKGIDSQGVPGKYASAVLSLASLCRYRYIMSGTPMPQGSMDLINQYKFMFPRSKVSIQTVYDEIKKLYVRTNKMDLGIPDFELKTIGVQMSSLQKELYDKIKYVERRKYETSSHSNRLRNLKKSVMRMLQIASNPRIINDPAFHDLIKLQGLEQLIEEASPKFLQVCELARSIAEKGEKVIIWSGFRENIKLLESQLADLNPVVVDGGVPSSPDDNEIGTREYNINKFKTDKTCKIFIANPAAASEGISLHIDHDKNRLCSHAIYLDRNFNAAQFIQSVDRIHRLGMIGIAKVFVFKTTNSMDERVQERLDSKIDALMQLLDDPTLKPYTAIDPTIDSEDFLLDQEEVFLLNPDSEFSISIEEADYYAKELLD